MIFVILFIVLYLSAGALVSFSNYCYWKGRWKDINAAQPRDNISDPIYYLVFVPLTWPIALVAIPQGIFHKYPLKF